MDAVTPSSRDETLLIFAIHGIRCAVPAQSVDTIVMPPRQLAHPPGSNRTRPGIFAHNRQVHNVIDLREAFGLGESTLGGRLLLYHFGAQHYAFVVDEVVGLVRSEEGQWAPLPADLPRNTFTRGFLYQQQIVLCCDFARLLRLEDGEPLRHHFAALVAARASSPQPDAPRITAAHTSAAVTTTLSRPPAPQPRAHSAVVVAMTQERPMPNRTASLPRRTPQRTVPPSPVPRTGAPPRQRPFAVSPPAPRREAMPPTHHLTAQTGESQRPPSSPSPLVMAPSARPRLFVLLLALLALGVGWWLWPDGAPPYSKPKALPALSPALPEPLPTPPAEGPRQPLRLEKGSKGVTLIVEESALTPATAELTPPPPREERRITHRVRKGETLWGIAERYVHDPWRFRELAQQSGIDNPNLIYPGDQVTIVIR